MNSMEHRNENLSLIRNGAIINNMGQKPFQSKSLLNRIRGAIVVWCNHVVGMFQNWCSCGRTNLLPITDRQ